MRWLRLRSSEWVLVGFFGYIVAITPFFPDRPHLGYQPVIVLTAVFILLSALARSERGSRSAALLTLRDWLPIPLTFAAFREMELFVPVSYPHFYEHSWIRWDQLLLQGWHLKSAIESMGQLVPFYLEWCYFLVYGVGAYCVGLLYLRGQRMRTNQFLTIYLLRTLGAYSLFPYFPSQPPRLAFPLVAAPAITTWIRQLNLWMLQHATIDSGSVSKRPCVIGLLVRLGYVSPLARTETVWVRIAPVCHKRIPCHRIWAYHYAVDAIAGFAVSMTAGILFVAMSSAWKGHLKVG